MPGGTPESLDGILAVASIPLLGFATYVVLPRAWPAWARIILAVLQAIVALAILFGVRLFYVLHFGIDTL